MTNVDRAFAHLDQLQDDFGPIAKELNHARAALKRSKSKTNRARFAAAELAFIEALVPIDTAHEALAQAEILDMAEVAAEEAEIRANEQPDLF